MLTKAALHLCMHGLVVLLIGLLCGIPYGTAIKSKKDEPIRAWKLAHSSLCMGATTIISISSILSQLEMTSSTRWTVVIAWSLCGYGFSFSLPLAAATGVRGLSLCGPLSNKCVYIGNVFGAIGSLVGTLLLLGSIISSL